MRQLLNKLKFSFNRKMYFFTIFGMRELRIIEKVDVLKTYMCLIVLFYLGVDSSFSCCFVKFPFRDLEEVSSFPESHLARADHVDCMFKCFIFR